MSRSPSRLELKALPFRAVVAFAARCARRVLPLYQSQSPGDESSTYVEKAIQLSERFAAGDDVTEDAVSAAATGALHAAFPSSFHDRDYATVTARYRTGPATVTARAAYAAFHAARAAFAAFAAVSFRRASSAGRNSKSDTAKAAAFAAIAAEHAVAEDAAVVAAVVKAARADFNSLLAQNLGKPLELGSNIDTSESGPLGPLWPEGLPTSLKSYLDAAGPAGSSRAEREGSEPQRLVLEAEVDESADTEEVADALANLCYALNAYHIAAGGNGLAIDEWQILVPESSPAGAM